VPAEIHSGVSVTLIAAAFDRGSSRRLGIMRVVGALKLIWMFAPPQESEWHIADAQGRPRCGRYQQLNGPDASSQNRWF
jgi:hypothetical protein